MKRNFFWTASAIAAAMWLGAGNVPAIAQNVDTTADAAAGSASTATDATGAASATQGAGTTTSDAAAPAASTAADAGASAQTQGQADIQSSTQPGVAADATTSQDAAAGAAASAPAQPSPPTQPGVAADVNAGANVAAGAAQPENQAPGAAVDGTTSTDVDASVQGDANLRANTQLGAQQNLATGLQFGQPTERGLAINSITRDHVFFNSGLRQGDVLMSFAGRPIRTIADFQRFAVFQPGQRVPVVVLRQGRPETILVTFNQRPGVQYEAGYAPSGAYLGVTFDAQIQHQATVRIVAAGSPAEQAGIRAGDVIYAVNGNRVSGPQDAIRFVASMQPGQAIDVAISRQIILGVRPGVAQASYGSNVRLDAGVVPPAVPAVPAPAPAVIESDTFVSPADVDRDVDVVVPGAGRFDNTPARAGDVDRDGRLLDADGRVGPVEGRAILPRRRN